MMYCVTVVIEAEYFVKFWKDMARSSLSTCHVWRYDLQYSSAALS